ncbi:uncharacterized protein LOC135373324 [Ornithodoros turicata]|uniref:uncharacterized protein LOC135373324 n=1 Tax=Ornithodoros turicata TaxID=34597 RepID=UPI00313963B9
MNEASKKYRARHCFVTGCTSGYRSAKEKRALFSVPKDSGLFVQWQRNIPRKDKELEANSVVCELHFDERFIDRHYAGRVVINGEVVQMGRERLRLKPDAVPTIFPNCPFYLSKKLPQKRKERNPEGCDKQQPCKRQRTDNTVDVAAVPSVLLNRENYDETDVPDETSNRTSVNVEVAALKLPSGVWMRHNFGETTVLSTSVLNKAGNDLLTEKLLIIKTSSPEKTIQCARYMKGKLHDNCDIQTIEELQSLLNTTDELTLCIGCGAVDEFVPVNVNNSTIVSVRDGQAISKKCSRIVGEKGSACLHCKYARKLLFTQRCKARGKVAREGVTLKMMRQRLMRRDKKVRQLKEDISVLHANTAATEVSVLESKIKDLPPKQQLAVKHCFQSAQRKSNKGMPYTKDWVLECIIMRMKSPRLYEHLRRHKILCLPSPTTLRSYLKNYKSGFGFNPNLFSALAKKTATMQEFECHGQSCSS